MRLPGLRRLLAASVRLPDHVAIVRVDALAMPGALFVGELVAVDGCLRLIYRHSDTS